MDQKQSNEMAMSLERLEVGVLIIQLIIVALIFVLVVLLAIIFAKLQCIEKLCDSK